MKKHFIPMLVLFAFMITMQSENILADHAHNEDFEYETRWIWNGKVWHVNQAASDDDIPHHMDTSVRTSTTQQSWTHMMYARAYFKSRYAHPRLEANGSPVQNLMQSGQMTNPLLKMRAKSKARKAVWHR